jgi:hypothetical protein
MVFEKGIHKAAAVVIAAVLVFSIIFFTDIGLDKDIVGHGFGILTDDPDLFVYYPLDSDSDSYGYNDDVSGNAYTSLDSGSNTDKLDIVNGVSYESLNVFSDAYLELDSNYFSSIAEDSSPQISFSFWMNPNIDTGAALIFESPEVDSEGFELRISSVGQFIFSSIDFDVSTTVRSPSYAFNNEEWQHVLFIFDSTATTDSEMYKLFRNGESVSLSMSGTSDLPLYFHENANLGKFDGYLDEFKIFTKVLSEDEICEEAGHIWVGTAGVPYCFEKSIAKISCEGQDNIWDINECKTPEQVACEDIPNLVFDPATGECNCPSFEDGFFFDEETEECNDLAPEIELCTSFPGGLVSPITGTCTDFSISSYNNIYDLDKVDTAFTDLSIYIKSGIIRNDSGVIDLDQDSCNEDTLSERIVADITEIGGGIGDTFQQFNCQNGCNEGDGYGACNLGEGAFCLYNEEDHKISFGDDNLDFEISGSFCLDDQNSNFSNFIVWRYCIPTYNQPASVPFSCPFGCSDNHCMIEEEQMCLQNAEATWDGSCVCPDTYSLLGTLGNPVTYNGVSYELACVKTDEVSCYETLGAMWTSAPTDEDPDAGSCACEDVERSITSNNLCVCVEPNIETEDSGDCQTPSQVLCEATMGELDKALENDCACPPDKIFVDELGCQLKQELDCNGAGQEWIPDVAGDFCSCIDEFKTWDWTFEDGGSCVFDDAKCAWPDVWLPSSLSCISEEEYTCIKVAGNTWIDGVCNGLAVGDFSSGTDIYYEDSDFSDNSIYISGVLLKIDLLNPEWVPVEDFCLADNYLVEQNIVSTGITNPATIYCHFGCSDGSCNLPTEETEFCEDSGSSLTFLGETYTDGCALYTDAYLLDHSCDGNGVRSAFLECAFGCEGGACKEESQYNCEALSETEAVQWAGEACLCIDTNKELVGEVCLYTDEYLCTENTETNWVDGACQCNDPLKALEGGATGSCDFSQELCLPVGDYYWFGDEPQYCSPIAEAEDYCNAKPNKIWHNDDCRDFLSFENDCSGHVQYGEDGKPICYTEADSDEYELYCNALDDKEWIPTIIEYANPEFVWDWNNDPCGTNIEPYCAGLHWVPEGTYGWATVEPENACLSFDRHEAYCVETLGGIWTGDISLVAPLCVETASEAQQICEGQGNYWLDDVCRSEAESNTYCTNQGMEFNVDTSECVCNDIWFADQCFSEEEATEYCNSINTEPVFYVNGACVYQNEYNCIVEDGGVWSSESTTCNCPEGLEWSAVTLSCNVIVIDAAYCEAQSTEDVSYQYIEGVDHCVTQGEGNCFFQSGTWNPTDGTCACTGTKDWNSDTLMCEENPGVLPGDVTGLDGLPDGNVDLGDAIAIAKHVMIPIFTLDDSALSAAEVDCQQGVSLGDAIELAKTIMVPGYEITCAA